MSGLSKWKAALYLAAIFCAGGVSGWFVAAKTAKRILFTSPRWEEIDASTRERLRSKLNLTPEQSSQVGEILEETSHELRSMHEKHMKLVWEVIRARNDQIADVLTPGQLKDFTQMEKERQEWWRRKEDERGRRGGRDGRRGGREREATNNPARSLTNSTPTP